MERSEITVNGNVLRMITYDEPLYRGDKMTSEENRANTHYTTQYHKFFATQESETKSYIENAPKGYTKEWALDEPLFLLDIMDLNTRHALEHLIDHPALLDTAFPIRHNKVYRTSEAHTAQIDARLLGELCAIRTTNGRPIDGYYMAKQRINNSNRNRLPGIIGFHSEVGLCSSAFHKLRLTSTKLSIRPPKVNNERKTKKRTLAQKPVSPPKKATGRRLFGNTHNNNKSNSNNNNNKKNNTRKSVPFLLNLNSL